MDEFIPFLRIIHITDMHVVSEQARLAPKTHKILQYLNNLLKIKDLLSSTSLAKKVQDLVYEIDARLAGHDPFAKNRFEQFLRDIVQESNDIIKLKTWLVFSGDLTSFGDRASLDLGKSYLGDFQTYCHNFLALHGNHDVWRGEFPLLARDERSVDTEAVNVHDEYLTTDYQRKPLTIPFPCGNGEVQLYGLDTVSNDRYFNSLSIGKMKTKDIKELVDIVEHHTQRNKKYFRILCTHHPVYGKNAKFIGPRSAIKLSKIISKDVKSPLFNIFMSGHTHNLYPDFGSLTNNVISRNDQFQLIAGSLMQLDRYEKRGIWPHQCQVLHIYQNSGASSQILIERMVAARIGRINGFTPYKFVRIPISGELSEEIILDLQ